MIITIDGPAGTGKTTVAENVAAKLSLPYFDTGAMYRAVALLMIERGITIEEKKRVEQLLEEFTFEIRGTRYFANGRDVTTEIRSQTVNQIVSPVSALPIVREALWKIQRKLAQKRGGVFEGRDMGSVVFPKAEIKIFLTAKANIRAQRRFDELQKKRPEEVKNLNEEEVLKQIHKRDESDSTRALAPLQRPPDAYSIDTSNLTIDEVVDRILEYCEKKNLKLLWMQCTPLKFLYRLVIFLSWLVGKIFYRHKVYGLEHFYPRGALIASNHTSFLDPPILAISWPEEVHFLARETLFKNYFFGKLIRALNTHPVSGDAGDITVFKTVCALLEEGKKVILFPEGTRSVDEELGIIKPGIGMFISRTKTAVIPAYIDGPNKIWNRKRKFPKLRGKTVCVFGSPIIWDDFAHLEKRKAQEAIANRVRESILNLKKWFQDGARGIPP